MGIEEIVKKLTKNYPLYSQENVTKDDKLVNKFLKISWYITEYDPKTKNAFGYVE